MGDPLLSLVPEPDRALVLVKTDALAPNIHSGELYGRRAVALTVTAMAPWLAADKLALLLRYCLWTVRLDARLDAPGADLVDVRRTAASVMSTLDGRGDHEPDLAAILAGLRAHGRTGGFADALRDAVAAGVEHAELSRRVAGGQPPPTVERYLDLGSRDVNYRSVALALLLLNGDSGTSGTPGGADRFDRAIRHACRAVRLANDLRTAIQDRADRRLNILALRTRAGAPVTPEAVERWIDHHVDAHSALLAVAPGQPSRALENGLRMAVGLYRLAPSR